MTITIGMGGVVMFTAIEAENNQQGQDIGEREKVKISPGKLLPEGKLRELSRLRPWINMVYMAREWVIVLFSIAISEYYKNPLLYIAVVFVIGGRMHAMAVLGHEIAHHRFLKNRKLSDAIGDVFLAWPILVTIDSYRNNHLRHHRFLNTNEDPDWAIKLPMDNFHFPKKKRAIFKYLLGYLCIAGTIKEIVVSAKRLKKLSRHTATYKKIRLAYYIGILTAITALGGGQELLLYWVVPFLSTFFCFMYIRSVAEHFGSMRYEDDLNDSRTVYPYFWENWFLSPNNVNYHLDHHLYPGVPFYNLPRLHALLMENPYYREHAHMTRGYSMGLLRECTGHL